MKTIHKHITLITKIEIVLSKRQRRLHVFTTNRLVISIFSWLKFSSKDSKRNSYSKDLHHVPNIRAPVFMNASYTCYGIYQIQWSFNTHLEPSTGLGSKHKFVQYDASALGQVNAQYPAGHWTEDRCVVCDERIHIVTIWLHKVSLPLFFLDSHTSSICSKI